MLDQITPVILTYNEGPNIGRTLERLRWARDIVVVDSFSDDETLEVVSSFSQARVYRRAFDTFAAQWTFALNETDIKTDWVMGLDADFLLTEQLFDELKILRPAGTTDAYRAPIHYSIAGKQLRFSLLPPLVVLYRRLAATYAADAHTYRVNVAGDVEMLRGSFLHDDRKSLNRWFHSQMRYAQLEAEKLLSANDHELNLADRVRRLRVIAPAGILFYCLLGGGLLDGWRGLYYAMQRATAEFLLSLYLLEIDLHTRTRCAGETVIDERSDASSLNVAGKSIDAAG